MIKVSDNRKQIHKDLEKMTKAFVKAGGKINLCPKSKRRLFSNRGYRK